MISTYTEYVKTPKSLTIEQMQQLHEEIISNISNDEDALEIYDELLQKANEYCAIRAKWLLLDKDKKNEIDDLRTSHHNSLIIKFNMLSRYLALKNIVHKWRDILGDEKDNPYCRKRIGDFACYLVFINSLNSR